MAGGAAVSERMIYTYGLVINTQDRTASIGLLI